MAYRNRNTDLLTTRQAAGALACSQDTIARWCDEGRLPAMRTAAGYRLIPRAAVEAFGRGQAWQEVVAV